MTVLSLIGKAACLKNYHQDSNLLIMQRFDKYIIGKFLKTFFFGISIFVVIVVVFDISEKIDDFLENNEAKFLSHLQLQLMTNYT